jgi:hypothetical protein
MHWAYFSSCASVGPDWPEELEPAEALDRVVVVDPILATPEGVVPPQAVTRRLKAASTARTARGGVAALRIYEVSRNRARSHIVTALRDRATHHPYIAP